LLLILTIAIRSVKNLEVEYPNGIQSCGADSLRFALISYTQQTRQINMDLNNVVSTTHFGNKIWNLFKYGLNRIEMMETKPSASLMDRLPSKEELYTMPLVNRFILSRLATAVTASNNGFEKLRLHEATDATRRFIVEDLCDVYVEFSKSMISKDGQKATALSTLNILSACMDVGLRLTHPFMPFITEVSI
jgi:valyl-tRNA synthetase